MEIIGYAASVLIGISLGLIGVEEVFLQFPYWFIYLDLMP